jgi:hypothetical protein
MSGSRLRAGKVVYELSEGEPVCFLCSKDVQLAVLIEVKGGGGEGTTRRESNKLP